VKPILFRSPEEWKSALMTLPDNAFFELMRSVFGNIKTPFNKQRLMEDLASFLSRREIQETIAAYIDETDAKVIAAIAVLGEPAPGELESFFAGEFTYTGLHGILLNLEERLILYRFREEAVHRLALNPLLEPALRPFIVDKRPLFPSFPAKPAEAGNRAGILPEAMDNRLFAAFLAFATDEREFYKAEGGIRKKVLDDGGAVFPGLKLDAYIGGLQCLGLLRLEGERLEPDERKLAFFKELGFQERLEYYAAGIGVYLMYTDSSVRYFNRGQIQSMAGLIHELLNTLERGRRYPVTTLRRIAEIFEREEGGDTRGRPDRAVMFASLLGGLEKTGLLLAAGTDLWEPAIPGAAVPMEGKPVIAMDTAFSCVLFPGIAFADAVALSFFCSVREVGATVRFELTRNSVVRGFNRGMDAAAMLELLYRLTGSRVDQNLGWTLKEWETRYSGVSLHEGIVLTLSPERRYLAEAMAPMITRNLAPGVYLLSAAEKAEAIQALQKAGVDIIAQPPSRMEAGSGEFLQSPYPPSKCRGGPIFGGPQGENPGPDVKKTERNKERFRLILQKTQLPKPVKDELAARIERRLILSESQLIGSSVRYEKLEAQGLDYVGKTTIAKQAIASKSLIEVFWPGQDGTVSQSLGIPDALEKQGRETFLVLHPIPQGNTASEEFIPPAIRLPLGKISLLRRIKQSIFGE
jgi:hypothetical protein